MQSAEARKPWVVGPRGKDGKVDYSRALVVSPEMEARLNADRDQRYATADADFRERLKIPEDTVAGSADMVDQQLMSGYLMQEHSIELARRAGKPAPAAAEKRMRDFELQRHIMEEASLRASHWAEFQKKSRAEIDHYAISSGISADEMSGLVEVMQRKWTTRLVETNEDPTQAKVTFSDKNNPEKTVEYSLADLMPAANGLLVRLSQESSRSKQEQKK